ncbi:MAG: hypothetical protein ACRCTX_20585 [Afipia sp.]
MNRTYEVTEHEAQQILTEHLDLLKKVEDEWGIGRPRSWVEENDAPEWWKAMRDHFGLVNL